MQKGILAKETHEKVIRFAPPLIITKTGYRLGYPAHPRNPADALKFTNSSGKSYESSNSGESWQEKQRSSPP